MRIVVLDGYALNPGDLDWKPLQALGSLKVYHRSSAHEVAERARESEILLTNKAIVSRESIGQLPGLRYIGVLASGYNIVDVQGARELGIVVTNVPGYSRDSVVQLVFGFILEFFGHASDHIHAVRGGAWVSSPDWSFTVAPIRELAGKTLGIIGMGAIGKTVAQVGHAFGMKVIASGDSSQPAVELTGFQVHRYPLDQVVATSDVLSLHCPLTDQTRHLMNAERISKMKPSSILINTARGPLVDERALAEALEKGMISGAGLDVLYEEPPRPENPLLKAPHCLITPHIAWSSLEARGRLMEIAVDNIKAFLSGNPINVVQ